ncbi:adenylate/guanylate cyclase domain-containing protein [Streptomyces sp. NBC_00872]|uniref:adenylate/guanylate cyclase domain-containing protein n=1 Tax=Streptomyces sp. NBC_00872 TaxID=2903686 RepID=UPI00386BDFFB|nr:AAA family ATPase [Streptomyces sp. NBC_00872]
MRCASCEGLLPRSARFCPLCGATVAARPVPQAEERRTVTVVFCDLVGSTALSGTLDPEALRAVTLRYFGLMRSRLEEFGGTVEKFIGDAVMAVFGIPEMHEDDALRALTAALAMLDAVEELNDTELEPSLGIRLRVRIGVNSGPVVSGTDVSARQALVSGETVNIAARLEQHASPGEILIGPETRRAAGAGARTESVGPLTLKGKSGPFTAYRLTGIGEDAPELLRRFDVPFVGRERELTELDLALADVSDGHGSYLVTVYGDAGMGKTRLLHEWRERTASSVVLGPGRCRPYGDHGSLAPLAEAITALLGRTAGTGTGADTADADTVTGERPGEPAGLAGLADLADLSDVADLSGLDLSDPAERAMWSAASEVLAAGLLKDGTPNPSVGETCAAVVALLTVLSRYRTVVVMIDDCHWASDPLLDVLGRLIEELDPSAVLFVCLARPELLDRRPGWGSGRLRSRALMLPRLTAAESETVALALTEVSAHWAGADGGAVPVRVLEAAGGNPFYLEQLLATVSEPESAYGADGRGDLPPTLQALLGARIGALGGPERAALDLAAVVGREFTTDEVAALAAVCPEGAPGGPLHSGTAGTGAGTRAGSAGTGTSGTGAAHTGGVDGCPEDSVRSALTRLCRRRLVQPVGRTASGRAPLRFSNVIVHEITYESMAKRVRAERHERAADVLLTRTGGESGGPAAERPTPLRPTSQRPAPPHPAQQRPIPQHPISLPSSSEYSSPERDAAVAGHLERAFRYRAELGVLDARTGQLRRRAAQLLINAGSQALARSDLAWAGTLLARAVELSTDTGTGTEAGTGTEPEWAEAARRLGEVRLATGRTDEGRGLLLAVLGTRRGAGGSTRTGDVPAVEAAHARLALAAAPPADDPGDIAETARLTLPVFERAGDELGQARACIRMAQERQLQGRHGQADSLLTRALDHAVRHGAEPERALALGAIGVSLWRGPEPVPTALARGCALLAEHGGPRPTVRLTLNCPLAVLVALRERWDEARARLADARRIAAELGYAEGAVVVPMFAAAVESLAGRGERALDLLDEAADAADGLGAGGLLGTVTREAARVLLDAGRVDEAEERLASHSATAAGLSPGGGAAMATTGLPRSDTAALYGVLARISAARERAEEALVLASDAVSAAGATDSPVVQAVALLDRAEVLGRLGRRPEAREAAELARGRFGAKKHLPGLRRAARTAESV